MGFDSRHLVLEFLAENRTLGISQMTLVFFGKKSDVFLQECLKTSHNDRIYVYHSKGTRLFWKEYGFDKLSGSIIELLLDTSSAMNINKKDLTFTITEPFYGLDLRKFDFDYLSIIPIKEAEELLGYALLYGTKIIEEVQYPYVSLKRLFRNIVKNENQAKIKEFDALLENKLGYLDFKNKLYLSKTLSEKINFSQKIDDVDEMKSLLLQFNYMEVNVIVNNEYIIRELEKNDNILIAADELDKPKNVEEFTLFYIQNTTLKIDIFELLNKISEAIKLVFPNTKANYYKVAEDSIALLFNTKYLKKDINKFKLKLKDLLVIDLRGGIDIPKKSNLLQVIKYLELTKNKVFNYEDYQNYRLNQSANKYYNGFRIDK